MNHKEKIKKGIANSVFKSLSNQSSETYNFNYYVSKSPENNQIIGIFGKH